MQETGIKNPNASLESIGLGQVSLAHWNLSPAELIEETLISGDGTLTDTGALAIDTGEFTGRSPKDKYVVFDEKTKDSVWWGDVNNRFESDAFDRLYNRVCAYFNNAEVYVRDSYACADPEFQLNIRVVTELPWSNLFANNLFLRPNTDALQSFVPEWHIINAPGFKADPSIARE